MNVAIAATVFPVIFIGELPDKTMFASLVLASRGRPAGTWLGAAAAFAIHVVLATTVGVLAFRLLPALVLETATALVFLAGAVIAARAALGAREPDKGPGRPADAGASPPAGVPGWRPAITAFAVIFAAEWGDLTQILTANLTAQYHSPVSVGTGALLALWSASAIAVAGGRHLSRLVRDRHLQIVTAVMLTALAAYAAWTALR